MPELYKHWASKIDDVKLSGALFAFDCDKTLINGDIGEATLRLAVSHRWVISHEAWWDHLRELGSHAELEKWRAHYERECSALEGQPSQALSNELWDAYQRLCEINVESAYVYAARIAYHRSPVELALLTDKAFHADHSVSERESMRDFTARLNSEGQVWVVSSSHVDIVRVIASHYHLLTEQVVGIDFERDPLTQVYTDQLISPAPIGALKVDALKRFTQQKPHLMAGDSRHDLPMMKYASSAIFIDHQGDSGLRESAKELGALIFDANKLV